MESGRFVLTCVVVLVACTAPGPREQGLGQAAWDGEPPVRWSGACVYDVQTRWATALPHSFRLTSDSSEWSLVISSPRRFPTGVTALSPFGEGGTQGLVLEGNTARGAILGTLSVTRRLDSTFVEVSGTKVYRDTVRLEGACRLGPISALQTPGSMGIA